MQDPQKPAQQPKPKKVKLPGTDGTVLAQVSKSASFPRCLQVLIMGETEPRVFDERAVQFVT
jgi:hypothetical protein